MCAPILAAGRREPVSSSKDRSRWPRASEPTSRTTVIAPRPTVFAYACGLEADARSSPAGGPRAAPAFRPSRRQAVRSGVERTLSQGRSLHAKRVVLFVAPGSGGAAVVATRRVGGAVERNRARRILRAAWRQVAPGVEDGYDIVLVARQGIRGAKMQDLVAEMTDLLRRAEVARL